MAPRPPQQRAVDLEAQHRLTLSRFQGKAGALDAELDPIRAWQAGLEPHALAGVRRPVQLYLEGDLGPIQPRGQGAEGAQRGDPGTAPGLQVDGLPDARGDERRTPIPTEVAGHLAHEVEGQGVGVGPLAQGVAERLGVLQARVEGDDEVVVGAQAPTEVEAVGPVHVGRLAERLPVQLETGDGVEPFANQLDALVGQKLGTCLEAALVAPGAYPEPLQLCFVAIEVGVGDQADLERVGVHTPRHGGRHRQVVKLRRDRAAARNGAQGPAFGKVVPHRAMVSRGHGTLPLIASRCYAASASRFDDGVMPVPGGPWCHHGPPGTMTP